jgi:cytoskeleton protein RodZ
MMDTSSPVANSGKEFDPRQPALDVGMALRNAREALGMSVHDVAERIKFAPRQVEALEANDYAHLPQATFLRGFVRSYARVLELDEVPLLAALPTEPVRQIAAGTQVVDVAFPSIKLLQRVNVLWLAGALVVALALGLFVLLSGSESSSKSTDLVVEPVPLPTAEAAVSAVVETDVQPKEPEIQPKEPEVIKAAEPVKLPEPKKLPELKKLVEPKKSLEPVKAGQPAVKPAPKIEAASSPIATVKPSIPMEVLKRRPLHLVFGESTWAEVIDARGVILLSRTNPRGSEKWIGGPRHEPYDISIGKPAKVKMYYKGKEINLSAYAGMDVAHFKLE